MDVDALVEALCRASVPLELLPDLLAILFCCWAALWLIRFIVSWRPRLCLCCGSFYSAWLAWHVLLSGVDVLVVTHRRWQRACDVTEQFAQVLVEMLTVWTDLLLPFRADVCRWVAKVVRSLSLKQRLAVMLIGMVLYAILEAYRFVRRHRNKIMMILFHASFVIGGPTIWYIAGVLPAEWLAIALSFSIHTLPTIASLVVLSKPSHKIESQRLWLSFWSCWPLIAALEVLLGVAPRFLVSTTGAAQLHVELSRVMLCFVVWLQFWQGSTLLQLVMDRLLRSSSIMEMIGAVGNKCLRLVGSLGAYGSRFIFSASGGSTWRIMRLMQRLGSRLWIASVVLFAVVVVALLVWLFYGALSVVSSALTVAVWCLAAVDTADTLAKRADGFYAKKLSFWVLAMLWDGLTSLPYVGAVLRIFTPVAFSLWHVAGEMVFNRMLLPLVNVALRVLKALTAVFSFCPSRRSCDEEENENEDEGDEDEVEEEDVDDHNHDEQNDEAVEKDADECDEPTAAIADREETVEAMDADATRGQSQSIVVLADPVEAASDVGGIEDAGTAGSRGVIEDTGCTGGTEDALAVKPDEIASGFSSILPPEKEKEVENELEKEKEKDDPEQGLRNRNQKSRKNR